MFVSFRVVLVVAAVAADPAPNVRVDVSPVAMPGASVAPNFVGLSIEVGSVLKMMGSDGSRASFAQALRNLHALTPGAHAGPVLRLGGNSADDSCFGGGGGSAALCKYNISAAGDLAAYRAFAASTAADANVSYVIDVNFGGSTDPAFSAVPHVRALGAAALWPHVRAVEIGNEMDIYASHAGVPGKPQHRNASYTFGEYAAEFSAFLAALRDPAVGLPPKRVQGGTWASSSTSGAHLAWDSGFASYVSQHAAELASVSYHRYPKSHCGGENVTAAGLLGWSAGQGGVAAFVDRGFIAAARQQRVPFVVGEGNSASCGGMPGVSDTFAAALWALDFLPTLSQAGAVGMNFHGGPSGAYPAIAYRKAAPGGGGSGAAEKEEGQGRQGQGEEKEEEEEGYTLELRPLYYGLYAFSELVAGGAAWRAANVTGDGAGTAAGGDPRCQRGVGASGVCCLASCGTCGGPGCNDRPGGSAACCGGTVQKAALSCDEHEAPCVLDPDWGPAVVAHAAAAATGDELRVLVVAKSVARSAAAQTNATVCVPGAGRGAAQLLRLTAPAVSTKAGGGIAYAGQTFDGSTDGRWRGARTPDSVAPADDASTATTTCYRFVLPRLSAVLLVAP